MTEPKVPLTFAEAEAKPIIQSEQVIATAYTGEARHNMMVVEKLTGYSYSYIKKVLKKPHVLKFMDAELRKAGIVARAIRRDTIKETYRVSQGDIVEVLREVMDWKGEIDMELVKKLPKDMSAAIKTVKVTSKRRKAKNGKADDEYTILRTELTMHDKVGALGLLNTMLRISQEKPEEEGGEADELTLTGMIIEGPGKNDTAIDADFEVVEEEEEDEDESWLAIEKSPL